MNPTEQKQHKRRTDELAESITTLETAVADAVDHLRVAIGDDRTFRIEEARQQRSYVDAADRDLRRLSDERWTATNDAQRNIMNLSERQTEPLRRSFWGRLKWLIVGR